MHDSIALTAQDPRDLLLSWIFLIFKGCYEAQLTWSIWVNNSDSFYIGFNLGLLFSLLFGYFWLGFSMLSSRKYVVSVPFFVGSFGSFGCRWFQKLCSTLREIEAWNKIYFTKKSSYMVKYINAGLPVLLYLLAVFVTLPRTLLFFSGAPNRASTICTTIQYFRHNI